MTDSKKNRTKFSTEEEWRLIDLVEERPILWDVNSEIYRRIDLKPQCWEEVAKNIGPNFTGDDIITRFRSLKDTFMRNLRKVRESKQSGAGLADIYKPKWLLFDRMMFLKRVCQQYGSTSNLDQPESAEILADFPTLYYDEEIKKFVSIPKGSEEVSQGTHTTSCGSTYSVMTASVTSGSCQPLEYGADTAQTQQMEALPMENECSLVRLPALSPAPSQASSCNDSAWSSVSKSSSLKRLADSPNQPFTKKGQKHNQRHPESIEVLGILKDIAARELPAIPQLAPPPPPVLPASAIIKYSEEIFADFIASRLRSLESKERRLACQNAILEVVMKF